MVMADERALTVSLEEFGLSRYEARAYVSLVSRGTVSAGELAYYAEIPRTKVYPTLLKLEKKRLAVISKGKPIRCTATPPEDAFDGIIHEQIDKVNAMNSLVSGLKKASEKSRRSSGSEEKRYFHISAGGVQAQLGTMIEGAESSARITADQWGLGLLAECRDQLASALRRGVEVRIIIPTSQICSEHFRRIPDGAEIRGSEIIQNCFVFDQTEVMMIDSDDGKGAVFSSTDILGANQEKVFSSAWRHATRTRALADMSKAEAQEICKMIRTVNDAGLPHVLGASAGSKKSGHEMFGLLERNGISLRSRPLDDVIEIIDAIIQITCSGHVNFDANTKNIIVESRLNSGHSLPWVSVLEGCLQRQGYATRTAYQSSGKGEKAHIKISR